MCCAFVSCINTVCNILDGQDAEAAGFEQQLLLLFVEFQSDQNWLKMVAAADTTLRWLPMNGDIRAERILS